MEIYNPDTSGILVLLCLQAILCFILTDAGGEERSGPQFITVPPSRVDFANTKGATLGCVAHGNPAPTIRWLDSEGRPVQTIPGLRLIDSNGTLTFPPFVSSNYHKEIHAVVYRCVARNRVGAILSPNIRANGVVIQKYRVQLHDNHVMRGNTAVFKCQVPSFVKDYVTVTSWGRSLDTLATGDRFSILPSGELHIRAIRDQDGIYQYRCFTRNRLTGLTKSSQTARLYVAEPVNTAPEILDSNTDYVALVGDTLELPCVASGSPRPFYTWTKDGAELSFGERFMLQEGNLVVSSMQLDDGGDYVCEAKNEMRTTTVTRHVTVKQQLSVFFYPQKQTVDVGAFASFNCSVGGYPIELVQWYKDAMPLDEDDRVTAYDNGTMVITGMKREDRGMYQCVASNAWDTQEATMQLSLGAVEPVILSHFTNDTLQPGPTIHLLCKVAGNPLPDVEWYRDGLLIPPIKRYVVNDVINEDGDVISYLNISELRTLDGGLYRCQATSLLGSAYHEDRINVIGPPYVRPLANTTAIAEITLFIDCHVVGYPIQTITWYKGTTALPSNIRQMVHSNGTLEIRTVESGRDEGEYRCMANNRQGQSSAQKMYLAVRIPPQIQPIYSRELRQGERTQLLCIVSRGDLPISITWLKDEQPLPQEIGITVHGLASFSSSLSIVDVSPVHDGSYTCVASNQVASVNFTTNLTVLVPPRFVVPPEDTTVVMNQSVLISCIADGRPEPHVFWKKAAGPGARNFQDLPIDQRFQVQPNGSLRIVEAEEKDQGFYICQIGNDVGSDSKTATLTVFVPARFEIHEQNITVIANHQVALSCVASGHQPLDIMWIKNGALYTRLNTPGKFEIHSVITEGVLRSTLTIFNAIRDDTAIYTCHASNEHGDDEKYIHLFVQEPPEAPCNLTVLSQTSRTITIGWRPQFNGNSPITGYTLEYKNDTDPWQGGLLTANVPANTSRHRHIIGKLHPYFTYHIRVYAYNAIGISKPSDEILFTTDEEEPSGLPLNIELDVLGSQAIRITWRQPRADLQNGILLGYQIQYRDDSSPYQPISVPVETGYIETYTLTHLKKFTKYTLQILAYNRVGTGPWSVEYEAHTLEDVPSEAPQSVSGRPIGSTGIAVAWSPPAPESLNGILRGYKVYYTVVRKTEAEDDARVLDTTNLSVQLHNLLKYTNYSISVVAYTRVGEGIRSSAIHIRTEPDAPTSPADIKAHADSPSSIMVSWRPPLATNGQLTNYFLFTRFRESGNEVTQEVQIAPDTTHYLIQELYTNYEYDFWVCAATVIGKGEASQIATEVPMLKVPARILSFSQTVIATWKDDATLDCLAVGTPAPRVEWSRDRSHGAIQSEERIDILSNGSLVIRTLEPGDAGNYSCRAINTWGSPDKITIRLQILAPPHPPLVSIKATTADAVQVTWRSGGNGGSPIFGYQLSYKREHEQDWAHVNVNATVRSYRITDLLCGTPYRIYTSAFNRLGGGKPSEHVATSTSGEVPISPTTDKIVPYTNMTSVTLVLSSWDPAGCPIDSFSIQYKHFGAEDWLSSAHNIPGKSDLYTVEHLHPLSWYFFRVTAVNTAGPSAYEFKISTTAYGGGTAPPLVVEVDEQRSSHMNAHFYEDPRVFGPALGFVTLIVILLFLGLFLCSSRKEKTVVLKKTMGLANGQVIENNNFPTTSHHRPLPTIGGTSLEREPFLRAIHQLRLNNANNATPRHGSRMFNQNETETDLLTGAIGGGPYSTVQDALDTLPCEPAAGVSTFRSSNDIGGSISGKETARAGQGRHRLYDLLPQESNNSHKERWSNNHDYACLEDYRVPPHDTPPIPTRPPMNVYVSGASSLKKYNRVPQAWKTSSLASMCTDKELAHAYENACKRAGATPRRVASLHESLNYSGSDEFRSMSDIEAGIRRFTASPPMPTVPESGDHLLAGIQTLPKQGARPILPSTKPNTSLRHAHSSTTRVPDSECQGEYGFTQECEHELKGVMQVHQPQTNPRHRPARRVGPRKGYGEANSIGKASRGPKRRHRSLERRSRSPSSGSETESYAKNYSRRPPTSASEGYMSLPRSRHSPTYSCYTDSDEPVYKYDYGRTHSTNDSMSEPEGRHSIYRPLEPRRAKTPVLNVLHPSTASRSLLWQLQDFDDFQHRIGDVSLSFTPTPLPPPPPPPPLRQTDPYGDKGIDRGTSSSEEIEIQILTEPSSKHTSVGYCHDFTIV